MLMPDPVGSVMLGAYHGDGKPVASGALAAKSYAVEGGGVTLIFTHTRFIRST